MTPLYPYHSPSKSLADRLHTAEFDDALVDQIAWKNLRYNGCKVKSKEINKFTSQQTASAAQTGIGFANIISIGPTIGEMVIGGTGQTVFTVGGYYTSNNEQPPLSGLPGSFQVEVFSPKKSEVLAVVLPAIPTLNLFSSLLCAVHFISQYHLPADTPIVEIL